MLEATNFILPAVTSDIGWGFVARRLERLSRTHRYALLGDAAETDALRKILAKREHDAIAAPWSFDQDVPAEAADSTRTIVLLARPVTAGHWQQVQAIAARFGGRYVGINELLLPLGLLVDAMRRLPFAATSIDEALGFYCGDNPFGENLDKLEALCPLRGKSVVEFGPLDGLQTAFLVNAGAARVTCVEARPENAAKTIIARQVLGWSNVDIAIDDFHNVSSHTHGRFDLAFAHGVYYHSIAPFVFLENLISLSDRIYLGGYCATADNPPTEFVALEHGGRMYRAKIYREGGAADFYAGVNAYGYFFESDDLQDFFRNAGYRVQVLGESLFDAKQCAGSYLWFFASRD